MLQRVIKTFKCSTLFIILVVLALLPIGKDYIGLTQYIVNIKNCGKVASKR